jgi:hypothetical protein
MVLEIEQQAETRLKSWMAGMKEGFGITVEPDNPQVQMTSRGGIDILISPAPLEGSIYLTAMLRVIEPDDAHLPRYALARNMFQSDTNSGWFAFEPEEKKLCYQYRWDGFQFADFSAFLIVLENFMRRAEDIAREVAGAAAPKAESIAVAGTAASSFVIRA